MNKTKSLLERANTRLCCIILEKEEKYHLPSNDDVATTNRNKTRKQVSFSNFMKCNSKFEDSTETNTFDST